MFSPTAGRLAATFRFYSSFEAKKIHNILLQLYILKIVLDFLFFETSLAKVFYGFNHSVLLQWQTRISRFCFSFWSFDICEII
jgi:hypothetical protein